MNGQHRDTVNIVPHAWNTKKTNKPKDTTQKTKEMSNTNSTRKSGENPGALEE